MIVKAYKYKSSLADARRLNEHLWKNQGQHPELSETRHLYAADTLAGMRVMQALQRGSRAKISFWHITVSPITTLNETDRTRVVDLIITELKAESHPLMVLSHNEKPRARRGGGARHFHFILGHVSPTTGLALDMRNHVQRLQKVAAIAAFDIEGQTSVSSFHRSIVTHLSSERPDVARWLADLARKAPPLQQPRMTDAMRRSAAAIGFKLASFQAKLLRLWNRGASEQEFDELLSEARVMIRLGDRLPDSILLYRGAFLVGVLNNILRQPRSIVYEEAIVRFPGLFGKPWIVGDISKPNPTSSIEKLRQETTDRLEAMLRRMRTETLMLTYNPPDPKGRPEGDENPIAERLMKLAEGEAIFDGAIDLLWLDDRWVSAPIEDLIVYSRRTLTADIPSPLVGPGAQGKEAESQRPTEDSADFLDEDEVLPFRPYGSKI
jgi:hypothetical protein